jgi:hypothetical protein
MLGKKIAKLANSKEAKFDSTSLDAFRTLLNTKAELRYPLQIRGENDSHREHLKSLSISSKVVSVADNINNDLYRF